MSSKRNKGQSQKRSRSKNSSNKNRSYNWFQFFADITSRIGPFMTIVLLIYFFVTRNATLEQKQELIDKWLLIKSDNGEFYSILIILFLILVLIAQSIFYRDRIKIKEDEIKRLSEHKTLKQEGHIGKNLHHSSEFGKF